MAVPYFRLQVSVAERKAVDGVLQSGWLTTGQQCFAFENEFASAISPDVKAISVSSNTAGMHLVLEALGIGPGDEVIVPSLTFTATAEVVRYLGADVVFVDVDAQTLCITAEVVAHAITQRTKAIMVVHFGGLAADLEALSKLAQHHGLKLVEDAAHSFPCSYKTSPIGAAYSDAAVFSFYANKTITTGEGGMIVTRSKELAERCKVMRLHGIDRDAFKRFTGNSSQWRYDVIAAGFKYNLTDIAAALGREQLKLSEVNRELREAIADFYDAGLTGLPVEIPARTNDCKHAWHLYWIRLKPEAGIDRNRLESILSEAKIGFSVHYTPLHRMTYWRERYNLKDSDFPNSTCHGTTSLSLPIFSAMQRQEACEVISVIREAFNS